jgi:hypothetical protein
MIGTAPRRSMVVPDAMIVTAPGLPAGNDTPLRSPKPLTYGDASGAAGRVAAEVVGTVDAAGTLVAFDS